MVVVEYLMLWWDMLELGVWLWSGMMLTTGWGGWVQEPGVTASATWAPWDYSAKGFFFPSFACGVLDISFSVVWQKNILTKGVRVWKKRNSTKLLGFCNVWRFLQTKFNATSEYHQTGFMSRYGKARTRLLHLESKLLRNMLNTGRDLHKKFCMWRSLYFLKFIFLIF